MLCLDLAEDIRRRHTLSSQEAMLSTTDAPRFILHGMGGGRAGDEAMPHNPKAIRGRGTTDNPASRFATLTYVPDEASPDLPDPAPTTQFFKDTSRSIIAHNDSPDVGFDTSVNPYRGCEHGCSY